MTATTIAEFPKIKKVRTFLLQGPGIGGDYHDVKKGH
jgi:L-rhamnonate dehydratase